MKTFTIENQTNNITAHATAQNARSITGAERFRSAAALARRAADWPPARLAEIWNSLPGARPVSRFRDRATAVSQIWKAIQSLRALVPATAAPQPGLMPAVDTAPVKTEAEPFAPQPPGVAPPDLPAKVAACRPNKPPVAAPRKVLREGSKARRVLDLLNRPGGATLQQIMQATHWQAHSVRGFISRTVGTKMSLTVISLRTRDGERSYSIEA